MLILFGEKLRGIEPGQKSLAMTSASIELQYNYNVARTRENVQRMEPVQKVPRDGVRVLHAALYVQFKPQEKSPIRKV